MMVQAHTLVTLLILQGLAGPLMAQGVEAQRPEAPLPRGPSPFPPLVTVPELATPRNLSVEGLNPATFEKLLIVRNSGSTSLNAKGAIAARNAMMADGVIDAQERDFIDEITVDYKSAFQIRQIKITKAGSPQIFFAFAEARGEARQILWDAIYPPVDFATAWNGGDQGWTMFANEFSKGGFSEGRSTSFVMARLGEAWKESTAPNAYKPFRDVITRLHRQSAAQKGAGISNGKQLVYKAAAMVDWQEDGRIPDFLYNWLKQPQ